MNIIASLSAFSFNFHLQAAGNSVWSHCNASRAAEATSAFSGQGAAGTRPRTCKARTKRKETDYRYQEKRKGWPNGIQIVYGSSQNSYSTGSMQSNGKGSRPNTKIRPKVLPDAHTASGCRTSHSDTQKQSANV